MLTLLQSLAQNLLNSSNSTPRLPALLAARAHTDLAPPLHSRCTLVRVVWGKAGYPWLVRWAYQHGSSLIGFQPILLSSAHARALCSQGVSFGLTSAHPVPSARRGPSRPSGPDSLSRSVPHFSGPPSSFSNFPRGRRGTVSRRRHADSEGSRD